MRDKILSRIKSSIRQWLGVNHLAESILVLDQVKQLTDAIFEDNRKTRRKIDDIANHSIIGSDLGYKDKSQIIIIQFNRLTNAFKIVADNECKFESYQKFIRELREIARRYNAEVVAIDQNPTIQPFDLKSRILPDKKITDAHKNF